MDSTVAAALIAALSALLVAVVSLVTAFVSHRASTKAAKELVTLQRARDQYATELEAIRQGIRSIQHAKDSIRTVLDAVPTSLDYVRAVALLENQCSGHLA